MEIEINFRLDENGRTGSTQPVDGNERDAGEDDDERPDEQLDYSFQVSMTSLGGPTQNDDEDTNISDHQKQQYEQWIDDLLFDCEISDSGLMPRTFWVPAQGFSPRCALEQFALDVFNHHVPKGLRYDVTKSGAEWWCQLRPSPEKTGRYAMHCSDDDENENQGEDPFAHGISMHVDKDEELRILTGGTTYVHPHLSTVTYLTDFGSPTMIMNVRVHPLEGTWIVPQGSMDGFVSWPATGKHTSFDGRYLHAAPCNLMEDGLFEKQIKFTPNEDDPKWNKIQARRHRRVTFLVNIWLNHHPFDVNPFPDSMIDKMSGQKECNRRQLGFNSSQANSPPSTSTASRIQNTSVTPTTTTEWNNNGRKETSEYSPQKFVWPLGDRTSNERLELQVPLRSIRNEASGGGNVSIVWINARDDDEETSFRIIDDIQVDQDNSNGGDGHNSKSDTHVRKQDDEKEQVTTKKARIDDTLK